MQIGELFVRIRGDITGLERSMSAAQRAVSRFGADMERVGKRLTIGVTAPLAALGALSVRSASQMDSLKRGLIAVAGSAEEAEEQLGRLQEVAKLPGLGFREAIEGSIRLQAAGFAASLAEDALKGFGNALATVGAGKAELDAVTRALSQIAAKGKVSAEEINQIAEVVPQIRVVMQEAFGTSSAEEIQNMGISASDFVRRVSDELLKLERVTGGPANAFENLSDAWFRASAAIGERLLPAVVPLVEGMARMLEKARALNPETVKWGIALAGVAAAAGPLLVLVGVITKLSAAISALLALKTAATIAAMTTGVGALVVVLGGLSAWFIANKLEAVEAAGALDTYNDSLKTLNKTLAEIKLQDLRTEMAAVTAELDRIDASGQKGRATGGQLTGGLAENPRAVELRAQLASLDEQFRIVTRRLTDLRTEGEKAAEAITPPVAAAADEAERLAHAFGSAKIAADNLATSKGVVALTKAAAGRTANVTGGGPSVPGIIQTARMPAAEAGGGGILGQVGNAFSSQLKGLALQFGPLAAAAATLRPVFEGLMETLGPVLSTLSEPLRTIGALLGTVIAPVLRLLAPPLNLLAKGVSYVVEAFGWLIEALGKFVDKIVPDWISKAGKGLAQMGQDLQQGARDARRDLGSVGDDLTDLGDAAAKATAQLVNYANVRHINALRFGIGAGMGTGASAAATGRAEVIVNVVGVSAEVQVERNGKVVQRINSRGGTTRFQLAT